MMSSSRVLESRRKGEKDNCGLVEGNLSTCKGEGKYERREWGREIEEDSLTEIRKILE